MALYDMAKALDKVDPKSFALSAEARELEAAQAPAAAIAVPSNGREAEFDAQLDNAFRSVIEDNLPRKEEVSPTLRETMKAAFQSGNVVGSLLSSSSWGETLFPTPNSPELTDDQIADAVAKLGLTPLLGSFRGVTNQAEFDARANDIAREQKNLEIMEASGLTGVAASLVAGIVDLPTLLPVGKALQLGAKGASLATNAGKTAVAGVIDAGVSEAALQATQNLRTGQDAAINIAAGAVIGGALGTAAHLLVGRQAADVAATRLDEVRADASEGFPRMAADMDAVDATVMAINRGDVPAPGTGGSAGAAFSDIAAEAQRQGILSDAKVASYYLDRLPSITTVPTEYLGRVLGGKTLLGRPRDAFRESPLDTVRQFGRMFYSSPEISKANEGGALNYKGMTVEDHIGEDLAQLATFKAEVENVYAANKGRFKNVNDLAERAYYAALNEGIDAVHSDPAVEAVGRAFLKYSDYQQAKHVANNRLPENTSVMGSKTRVQRMYNQTALRENEETAKEMLFRWAMRKITADRDAAYAETGYAENMTRYQQSTATYAARVAQREIDYERALNDWNTHIGNIEFEAKAQHESAMRTYLDNVAAWASNPANDGKKAPYKKPTKTQFDPRARDRAVAKKWEDDVAAWKRDKANKGKDHPYGEKPEPTVPRKPTKGPEPLLTDGNRKPAHPKKIAYPQDTTAWARELAEDVYNTLAGVKSVAAKGAGSRVNVNVLPDYLKGRVVDIPDDALGDAFFLRTNLIEHADHMHYTSGRDAAMGSVFKTVKLVTNEETGEVEKLLVGDYDGTSILKTIEEEADAVINEVSGQAKTVLIEQREKMLNGVRNEIDIARGKFDVGSGLIGHQAAHYIASAAYAIRLGGVTISSLTDPMKIAISHGLGNTFRYGVLPMLREYRAAVGANGTMRQQGIRTGNVIEILHNTRMADAFELHNPHQVGSKWAQFIDKATRLATQLSLISHWTDFNKQVAHNVTSSRILAYAEMGASRLSKANSAWLANLGLDADDLAKIKAEYNAQQLKHVGGVLFADLDKWSDVDLAARFAAAFRREGRNNVVTPGLGDRPQFMSTPTGKLMYQFQTFMLTDQVRFVARQAQLSNIGDSVSERARQRIAFGAALSSLVVGAVFVDSMKRALRDNDVDFNEFLARWESNPGGSMYDAIDRAGFMGSLFGASNTVGKFSNGQFSIRGGAQWLAGDAERGEARKVRDIGLGGALLGPAAGIAEDTVRIGQALGKAIGGGDLTRADLRRMVNTTPYHAVPGIQQALGAISELTAYGLGIPPEAPR